MQFIDIVPRVWGINKFTSFMLNKFYDCHSNTKPSFYESLREKRNWIPQNISANEHITAVVDDCWLKIYYIELTVGHSLAGHSYKFRVLFYGRFYYALQHNFRKLSADLYI